MGALSLILTPRQLGTGDPAGQALENIIVTPLQDGALCYVKSGAAKGEWQLDKTSTAVADGTTVIEPISGAGRWLRFGSNVVDGSLLRSASTNLVVTDGTFAGAATEVKANMSSPANPGFRVALPNALPARNYKVIASFRYQGTVSVTATIQASADNFVTNTPVGATTLGASPSTENQTILSYQISSLSVPNFVPGSTLRARIMVATAEFPAEIVSVAPVGSTFLELVETE